MSKLDSLNETELKVMAVLHMAGGSWFGYGNCYYPHDYIMGGEGNIKNIEKEVGGKKGLSKIMKKLRELELVEYRRGLMTEDGEVAGSGHAPSPRYEDELEKLCDERGWL